MRWFLEDVLLLFFKVDRLTSEKYIPTFQQLLQSMCGLVWFCVLLMLLSLTVLVLVLYLSHNVRGICTLLFVLYLAHPTGCHVLVASRLVSFVGWFPLFTLSFRDPLTAVYFFAFATASFAISFSFDSNSLSRSVFLLASKFLS